MLHDIRRSKGTTARAAQLAAEHSGDRSDLVSADELRRLDELLDEGLEQTFPASDAVAVVQRAPAWSAPKHSRSRFGHS